MEMLTQLLEFIGPILVHYDEVLVGILTVPAFGGIKWALHFIDEWKPWAQQLGAATVALVMMKATVLLNVALPETLEAFTVDSTETAIAAAIAFAIHAGKKKELG